PDIFLAAAEKMGVRPENTMVFEDSYPALVTAKEAGFLLSGVWDRMSPERQGEIQAISDLYIQDFYTAADSVGIFIK
ncbi:MAG: HAD family phosphatase, partial [Clostridia bacterium]|nr:HAD family phosphatase [Clostridia bacterium]